MPDIRKGIQVLDLKAAVAFATPPAKAKPKKKPVPPQFRNDTTHPKPGPSADHQNIAAVGQEAAEKNDQAQAAGAGKPGSPTDRGVDPNENQTADPNNPNGVTQGEAQAAGQGNNTTNPMDSGTESDPGVDESDDRIMDLAGMEDHSQKAAGTDEVTETRDTLNQLLPAVSINAREIVTDAIRHLSDAAQQGNFGQWEGAAQSVAHAVAAIQRAQAITPDDTENDVLGKLAEAANDAGVTLLQDNQSPTLPLPVKTFEHLVMEAKTSRPTWDGPTYKALPVIEI